MAPASTSPVISDGETIGGIQLNETSKPNDAPVRRDAPFDTRTIEDFAVGQIYEYGAYEVSEAEIIDFATKFDPQPMHVDPVAAKDTPYGGLIAAGLHTGSIFMRNLIDAFPDIVSYGSPGWDEVRWLAPVRPGYVLSTHTEIVECRLSDSRPEMGIISGRHFMSNQDGEKVFSVKNWWFMGRRDQG